MKYKVSLLPEKNRKRIIGKRKAEKGRGIANVFMLILLAGVLIALCGKLLADVKLADIQAKNAKYENEVVELQEYEAINVALQTKLQLIEKIKVSEPALYNFVAKISNVEHSGVTMTDIICEEWKTTRKCTISGSAMSREAFNDFVAALEKVEGITEVKCTNYTTSVMNGSDIENQFTVEITCSGGAAPITSETVATTAAADTSEAA